MTSPLTPRQVAAVLAYQRAHKLYAAISEDDTDLYRSNAVHAECRLLSELQDALLADPEPKPAAKRGKKP